MSMRMIVPAAVLCAFSGQEYAASLQWIMISTGQETTESRADGAGLPDQRGPGAADRCCRGVDLLLWYAPSRDRIIAGQFNRRPKSWNFRTWWIVGMPDDHAAYWPAATHSVVGGCRGPRAVPDACSL